MARKKLTKGSNKGLTAMERKDIRNITRSEILSDPRTKRVLNRLYDLALDKEPDAPAQLQVFAIKTITDTALGQEIDPKGAGGSIVNIKITGIGQNDNPKDVTPPIITFNEEGEVDDDA